MSDDELILQVRANNKSAQDELLNKYIPMVNSIAAKFFLNGGEREDLVQEGMVGLSSAIDSYSFSAGASFSSYAYICIRNSVVDAVKKSNAAKNLALNTSVSIVEISGEPAPTSPEEEIIKRENRLEFLQKIGKNLSSLEFKTIVMYIDGASTAEIATALNRPQKSCDNALARAKSKLQKLYSAVK